MHLEGDGVADRCHDSKGIKPLPRLSSRLKHANVNAIINSEGSRGEREEESEASEHAVLKTRWRRIERTTRTSEAVERT